MSKEFVGVVCMIVCVLITSLAGVATRLVVEQVSVYTIVCVQYFMSLLLLLPKMIRAGQATWKTACFRDHLIRGAGGWLCFVCYYLAIAHVPLVEAALLRSASPLCVPFVVWILTGDWPRKRYWVPILIGFVGVSLILRPQSEGVSGWHWVGFMSAVTLAVSMVYTRKLTRTEPSTRILFYYFGLSFLFGLPFMVANWQPIPRSAIPYLLFIGGAIYAALVLYTQAYRYAPAVLVSPLSYTGIVFAGLWGYLLWAHVPDFMGMTGILLVIVGGISTTLLAQLPDKEAEGQSAGCNER